MPDKDRTQPNAETVISWAAIDANLPKGKGLQSPEILSTQSANTKEILSGACDYLSVELDKAANYVQNLKQTLSLAISSESVQHKSPTIQSDALNQTLQSYVTEMDNVLQDINNRARALKQVRSTLSASVPTNLDPTVGAGIANELNQTIQQAQKVQNQVQASMENILSKEEISARLATNVISPQTPETPFADAEVMQEVAEAINGVVEHYIKNNEVLKQANRAALSNEIANEIEAEEDEDLDNDQDNAPSGPGGP